LLFSLGSKSGARSPHEYIRDTLSLSHHECTACRYRTKFVCIRCNYCYSCHWKKEELEKRILNSKLNEISPPLLLSIRKNELMSNDAEHQLPIKQQQLMVNVYGKSSEPICSYHGCNHKFSVHGLGSCKCKHPTNKTLG
jgi:hypothetical protein